jgi:hypothetical protein
MASPPHQNKLKIRITIWAQTVFELLFNRVLIPSLDYYQQKQTAADAYISQVLSDHVPV